MNSGWDEFIEAVKILQRRSLNVRKVRELSDKDLYILAATNVALTCPTFEGEYRLIKEARKNLVREECAVCQDQAATEHVCRNAHLICKQCISNLYAHGKCHMCRGDLLQTLPFGPTSILGS